MATVGALLAPEDPFDAAVFGPSAIFHALQHGLRQPFAPSDASSSSSSSVSSGDSKIAAAYDDDEVRPNKPTKLQSSSPIYLSIYLSIIDGYFGLISPIDCAALSLDSQVRLID